MTSRSEVLAQVGALRQSVADFADKTVTEKPNIAVPDGTPDVVTHHGEESVVGHVHHWLDEVERLVGTMRGSD